MSLYNPFPAGDKQPVLTPETDALPMKILFASSEAHPLIKTGGLADVSGSLPRAIRNAGHDIRLILPAYPQAKSAAGCLREVAWIPLSGATVAVRILQGRLPGTNVPLYLVDAPECFDRPGGPYSDPEGSDWPDNAARFTLFCRAICKIALDRAGLDWQADLVHCNDWQTGLVPALLSLEKTAPATLFTIHNLAYQGLFNQQQFHKLGLPAQWWSMHGVEFHHQLSFIKGGLVFANWITTVSPTYAREIRTPGFGCGLEGLLEHRKQQLTGILNGVDYQVWNPGKDQLIEHTYTSRSLRHKAINKRALQKYFDLPENPGLPVFGHVGRLVEQKGVDLIIKLLPRLVQRPMQLVFLGTGNIQLERALGEAQTRHPGKIGVLTAYDEKLSHLIEAGSDVFLMPSRFEPCGLNQLYSLRYGTPPVVRNTGGLADSVVNASSENLQQQCATGFVFDSPEPDALLEAIDRALELYSRPQSWTGLMQAGMRQDFSWTHSAATYMALYENLLQDNRGRPG